MAKQMFSVFMAVMLTLMCAVPVFSASAAQNPVAFTLDYPSSVAVGDTVEVALNVSANSNIVNGDFSLLFDTDLFELIENGYGDGKNCLLNADLLGAGFLYGTNLRHPGEFFFAAATGNVPGLQAGGELLRVKFRAKAWIPKTSFELQIKPLCGNDGIAKKDYDISYQVKYTNGDGGLTIRPAAGHEPNPDIDGNNTTDIGDAFYAYLAVNGDLTFSDTQAERANVTGGALDIQDVTQLFSIIAGDAVWDNSLWSAE